MKPLFLFSTMPKTNVHSFLFILYNRLHVENFHMVFLKILRINLVGMKYLYIFAIKEPVYKIAVHFKKNLGMKKSGSMIM